jgi:hypothetical protein
MKYPWDDDVICTSEESGKLWKQVSPNDFYFHTQYDDDIEDKVLCLVPKDFYDRNGYWYDQHIPVDWFCKQWPNYLDDCLMEAIWAVPEDVSFDTVISDLTALGFIHNPSVWNPGPVEDDK